jgi:hypothetical protein
VRVDAAALLDGDGVSVAPSPQHPLLGRCLCGAVRFEVRAPFTSAAYCYCHRCQRRTGTARAASARINTDDLEILTGRDLIRAWQPADGMAKNYCGECGGHLFAGSLDADFVAIRLGTIDGDPGIRPEAHTWVSSAAAWEDIPDDGLPHYEGNRP